MQEQQYERSVFDDATPFAGKHLPLAAKWGKIIAIIGFAAIVIWALVSLYGILRNGATGGWSNIAGTLGEITGTLLIFFCVFYYLFFALYKFGTLTQQAVQTNSPGLFNEAFRYLKIALMTVGIIMIILAAFCVVGYTAELFIQA